MAHDLPRLRIDHLVRLLSKHNVINSFKIVRLSYFFFPITMASSSVGMQFGPMGTQIPIGQPQSQVNISDGQQQPQQPQPSYYSPACGDPAPLITPMMYSGSHRPGVMPSALPMSVGHVR